MTDTTAAINATTLGCSITCKDLEAWIRFYRDAIGFAVLQNYEHEGKVVAAVLGATDCRIVLNQDDGKLGWDRIKGQGFYLQFNVAGLADVDAAAARIKAAGGTLIDEPANRDWGVRMFQFRDLDGFKLGVSTPLADSLPNTHALLYHCPMPLAAFPANRFHRRSFVQCALCAAAGTTLTGPSSAFAFGQDPRGGREVMREFPYGAVQLTGGPIKQHFDRIHAHYLALDNDRLLKVFRERVGLPAPGPDMGGWYDTNGFVPGLTLGQYISGLARLGAATGDRATHEKVARLVAGFGEFIRRAESPYAGPNAQAQWAAYVMDKYVVGLVDAFQFSGVDEAKHLLPVTIDKCLPFISPVSRDRIGKKDPPYDETYVISENLFQVANITGDDKYRKLAVHYLLDKEWFDPLAAGIDVLPEKHAYSHTIALSSGAQAYLNLGDAKYLRALTNAWRFLEPQRFASGGWAPEEQFVHLGQGKLAESLKNSKAHFETPCGSYADLKLARYLIRLTGRAGVRRRAGAHALQHLAGDTPAEQRRRLPVLFGLRRRCGEAVLPPQVALLFRNLGAGCRRLRH